MKIRSDHTKTDTKEGVHAMKSVIEICVVGSILIFAAGAQESPKLALQKGVSVQMAVADHAVEMRAADEQGCNGGSHNGGRKTICRHQASRARRPEQPQH